MNAIAPGPTDTEATRKVVPDVFKKLIVSQMPLGRMANVSEMVGACLFLLSDEASFITAQILPAVTPENEHFWTGGAEGELRFLRCRACGYLRPPAGARLSASACPKELAVEAVSGARRRAHLHREPPAVVPRPRPAVRGRDRRAARAGRRCG